MGKNDLDDGIFSDYYGLIKKELFSSISAIMTGASKYRDASNIPKQFQDAFFRINSQGVLLRKRLEDVLDTYAIEGKESEICLNGAAARLGMKGDIIIILAYAYVEEREAHNVTPKLVYVDEKNAITKTKQPVEFAIL